MILMRARTTVRLPETLMREVKRLAADTDRTITRVIEDALHEALARRASAGRRSRARLPADGAGGLRPGVDLVDSTSLLDLMDTDGGPAGNPPR
jgi:predicted transcriptional regulator